jgi:hypothetical protein
MKRLSLKKRLGRMLTPIMRVLFRALQSLGLHVTRNHFYEPVPDTRMLKEDLWSRHSEVVGVEMNLPQQIALLEEAFPKYIRECKFTEDESAVRHEFHFGNDFFEAVDAEILHSMVRHFKPKRMIEIGSGHSTLVSARAAIMNREINGSSMELICVEPYPNEKILTGLPGLARLIRQPIQEVDMSVFRNMDRNDILFIDSSHVAKIGSDVLYEYLEILPRLRPGVLVHIHDIFIPDEYPKQWVLNEHKFWTEQYLLQAFLAFNLSFEVLWASSFMSRTDPERLERAIPSWKDSHRRLPRRLRHSPTRDGRNVWPVSFWIRRVR